MKASFLVYDIEHSVDMYGAGTLHRFSLRDVAKVLYDARPSIFSKGVDGGRLRDGVGAGTTVGWNWVVFLSNL